MDKFKECVYRDAAMEAFRACREVKLPSGKIVDLMSNEFVIEVDFVKKWAESIGQSLQYAQETGKRACIMFIYDVIEDRVLLNSVKPLLKRLEIRVYTIDISTRVLNLVIL
jgi:hypothetical protein